MENSHALLKGTILNEKYRIEEILGEGGFGITYKAYDTYMGEFVAIKEYFPSIYANRFIEGNKITVSPISSSTEEDYKKGLQRFENEAANLAKFNQEKGIVSVKNFFNENQTAYMVMEYVEGESLKEYLKKKPGEVIPYREALEMVRPIMLSLIKVHAAGIIHRDISPDNILVNKNNELKLIDFGASRFVENIDNKSLTIILKEGYSPIEQYSADGKQGAWTDIYSLCATLYKMITGITPVESVNRVGKEQQLSSVEKLCADIPGNISKSIMKGLEIDSKNRYKNVDALYKDIFEGKSGNIFFYSLVTVLSLAIMAVAVFIILQIKRPGDVTINLYADSKEKISEASEIDTDVVEENEQMDIVEIEGEEIAEEDEKESVEFQSIFLTCVGMNANVSADDDDEHWCYPDDTSYDAICLNPGEKYNVIGEGIGVYYISNPFGKLYYHIYDEDYNRETKIIGSEDALCVKKSLLGTDEDYLVYTKCMELIKKQIASNYYNIYEYTSFDDFDGDGTKELFYVYTNDDWQNDVEIWYSDGQEAKLLDKLYGKNIANQYNLEGVKAYRVGKNKIVYIRIYDNSGFDHSRSYVVEDGKIVKLGDLKLTQGYGGDNAAIVKADDSFYATYNNFYDVDGNKYTACMGDEKYYPMYYINGQLGECASTIISESDFMSIDGAEECLLECEKMLSKGYPEGINTFRGDNGSINNNIKYKDSTIKSILYNETGFFAINYIVDTTFESHPNSEKYYSSDTVLAYTPYNTGEYDYSTCEWIPDLRDSNGNIVKDIWIDKMDQYVIVAFEDGKLVPVHTHLGEQLTQSGSMKVLYNSDFSYYK